MTDPPHPHHDAAHAAEEPGVLSEYGNDTGFAEEVLGPDTPGEPAEPAEADEPEP
jgi:hypothetical protein